MIPLVVLGGTGDVYLISALVDAFRKYHQHGNVQVVLKGKFEAVVKLFPGVRYRIDDALVDQAERDVEMQRTYDNHIRFDGTPYYTHPCFERSRVRVDHMTTKPDASQADMYRMLLRVPPEASLTKPAVPKMLVRPNTVLLIPKAVSWPNTQPLFWERLFEELIATGREVTWNGEHWPMEELFQRCAATEWVIGPQCGVMSILATGEFPCRKTLATPSVDEDRAPGFLAAETYPYAYVTKFANDDYDVEEFKVDLTNREQVVRAITTGQNAQRLWPHDPRPVTNVMIPLTPGDALDRLAVLTVKRDRFPPARRAAIEREYQRHMEATRRLRLDPRIAGKLAMMIENHEAAFDVLEGAIPAVMQRGEELDTAAHVQVIKANRVRIDLKREVDAMCRAPYREVKSYYGPDGF